MTPQECINKRCKACQRRTLHKDLGLICSLTNQKPGFEDECPNYLQDELIINNNPKKLSKEILEELPSIILILAFCIIIGNSYPKALLVIGCSILICSAILFLLRYRKCSEKRLRKIICKYFYANGYPYKIKDQRVVFNANNFNYYLEIITFKTHHTIQLNCSISFENEIVGNTICANKTNQCYRFSKVRAFKDNCIFDTTFDVKHTIDFKQKFQNHLRLLQDAINHYGELYEDFLQTVKEKEEAAGKQEKIHVVGEA